VNRTAPLSDLVVGGFVPFTTLDFPGRLAAVVFCQGCPWRCRYCHNPHLQGFENESLQWTWPLVCEELAARRGFLEGVVFSGGEPTAQSELMGAIRDVRDLGFSVGLHSAGIFPERLALLLPLIDWIGFDVKAPFDARYGAITGLPNSHALASRSLDLVLASGLPFELRTTVHPDLLGEDDLTALAGELSARGAPPTTIQPFRPDGCRDGALARPREIST